MSTVTTTPGPSVPVDVQRVFDLTNSERSARGLPLLEFHPMLTQAAEAHGADQFLRRCNDLSHTGTDGSTPFVRIDRTGLQYSAAAENIGCGYPTPESIMRDWMNSSGHRANILDPAYTHIGVSVSLNDAGRLYWVQVFASLN